MSQSIPASLAAKPRAITIASAWIPVHWSSVALVAALATVVVLALLAQPRRTGDAHQYLAMANQLSLLRLPSLKAPEMTAFDSWLSAQPAVSGFSAGMRAIRQPPLMRDGQQEFSHFWLYPLLVAPVLRITTSLGAHPVLAFTVINAVLLGAAVSAAARIFGALAALAIIASPLVWFVARAQVEVFTVALLCLAIAAAASGRWGWSAIAVALTSTQNLPIAAMLPVIWLCAAINWRLSLEKFEPFSAGSIKQARIAAAFALASSAIVLMHPAYYLWRLGVFTPQQLNGGIVGALPSLQRILAPVIDPDIGFLAWMPMTAMLGAFGVVVATHATLTQRERSASRLLPLVCAAVMALWFLCVFAQTTNVNSGGTVHVSRYALWLLPLTLPAVAVVTRPIEQHWPLAGFATAVALFLIYAAIFRPAQPERYVEHSPQAAWLMTNVPALYHPLPEIFVERTLHIDGGPIASAATQACSLIFLDARQQAQPCTLSPNELHAAQELFSRDLAAVWIRRGASGSTISPALN